MEVSGTCRNFIDASNRRDWRAAVLNLNGLNMYEMLRSLHALDAVDTMQLSAACAALVGFVNAPRITYALTVVTTRTLPSTAPGDLEVTGQVREARKYLARPTSILIERIPKARLTGYNVGLTSATNATMSARLGAPRASYTQDCQPVTNKTLARRIVTRNVGPFSVTGLDSALTSLTTIMTTIQRDQRLVYRVLGTAGMHCARNVRGSTTSISNHSWGTAIDLTLTRVLDARGDNQVQFGLHLISTIFNAAGWYWGLGFGTEDAQHFEAGSALIGGW